MNRLKYTNKFFKERKLNKKQQKRKNYDVFTTEGMIALKTIKNHVEEQLDAFNGNVECDCDDGLVYWGDCSFPCEKCQPEYNGYEYNGDEYIDQQGRLIIR